MFIATLIAADRLGRGDISAAADALGGVAGTSWVEEGSACDLVLAGDPQAARARLEGAFAGIDVVVQPQARRRKLLLAADMDSTMIAVECIDELADFAGVRAEVAAVTEQAMSGELDFEAALDARVALLAGLEEAVLDRCREQRVRFNPGAHTLVATMRRHRAYALLVSGGFTRFAEPIAAAIGFDDSASNHLLVADGRLTGMVAKPIVDAVGKREAMARAAARRGIDLADTLAVGDGANDIPMIEAAGLGVAFHARPALAARSDARIDSNDLTALLFAQGYARSDWIVD